MLAVVFAPINTGQPLTLRSVAIALSRSWTDCCCAVSARRRAELSHAVDTATTTNTASRTASSMPTSSE